MKKRLQLVLALLMISVFTAGYAFCFGDECRSTEGRNFGHKGGPEAMTAELNLTPEQDKLLKEEKEASREQMKNLFEAMKTKKAELKDALAKPDATRQQVAPIAAQIKALQSEMVDKKIDGILKVKSILTPEQFQKMQAKHDQMQKEGRKRHHKEQ